MIVVHSPATLEQALSIMGRIRQADLDEHEVAVGGNIEDSLRTGLAISTQTWAGEVDGKVICVCGVAPVPGMEGSGAVWLVSTTDMEAAPAQFLRLSKKVLAQMLDLYGHLFNFADVRNTKALRWLVWLGFDIYEPIAYGHAGFPFHLFELRRTSHV